MADFVLPPLETAIIDWHGDTPFANHYGDSYFMPGQGIDESQSVFIEASDLPRRFSALPDNGLFVIGETGFGTGLNALLAADCFERHAPPQGRLHYFSAELHPLTRRDLAHALSHWPALAGLAAPLLAQWPPPAPGFHRIPLGERIELTLMFGDAATLWKAGPEQVDAWFLDGFAPARNRQMWAQDLFQALGARSQPGSTIATFTAAGAVRRGLASAGFQVERHEGFAGKRHRLTARRPGDWTPQRARSGHALVAGAGLAGCTTARALAERGWSVTIVDPALAVDPPRPLAAVLYASPSHHLNAQNRFYLGALLHARRWLRRHDFPRDESEGRLEGVIQHSSDPRIARKMRKVLESGAWPPDLLAPTGEGGVRIEGAGSLRPRAWRRFLLDHPRITAISDGVIGIERSDTARIALDSGRALAGDALVLCTAGATGGLDGLAWLPLRIVRGQVTFCRATAASRRWKHTHCHAGYLTPAFKGVHSVGATFDRRRQEAIVDVDDNERNLAELENHLPELWRALGARNIEVVGQHAGLRCQPADPLPLVGPRPRPEHNPHTLDRHVWLNIAHGSKGLTHTPLCADMIADRLSGHPLPTDLEVVAALAPERFIERRRRREPGWRPDIGNTDGVG